MPKFFIAAGEPSGDIHAARLMSEMKNINPDCSFVGIGGDKMAEAGLNSIIHISKISVVGFWEVAKKYFFFKDLLRSCENMLANEKIDAFIPVDYPGFNIRLASFAKKKGIPVLYYIAPQLWAWGKNRAQTLAKAIDKLLVVFPFEKKFFAQFEIDAHFVGHPLLDAPEFEETKFSDEMRENKIAFLPGSRKQEIIKHFPLIKEISAIVKKALPDAAICIARSKSVSPKIFVQMKEENPDWNFDDSARSLMQTSVAGIVKTGTSTLEAALCGMPFAMFYKTSPASYFIGKRLVNLPYISLANILADKFVVKEFVQREANPKNLTEEIIHIIQDKAYRAEMQKEFLNIKNLLGVGGASKKAAEIILNSIR